MSIAELDEFWSRALPRYSTIMLHWHFWVGPGSTLSSNNLAAFLAKWQVSPALAQHKSCVRWESVPTARDDAYGVDDSGPTFRELRSGVARLDRDLPRGL